MECNLRLLSQDEARIYSANNQWMDHTRATAIHTCNRWGIVRYMHGKALEVPSRELALEAGNAMHQAFAAHRLWQLFHHFRSNNMDARLVFNSGERIFGIDRWASLEEQLLEDSPNPIALETLYTSGYYDDPRDKRRTLSNMEQSLLMYLSRYEPDYIPYVQDEFIGIEVPIRIELSYEDGTVFLYTGRVDGVLKEPNTSKVLLVENKTSSNVSNSWEAQWRTSHQVTGYLAGLSLQLKQGINEGVVIGVQIPLPRTSDYKGYVWSPVSRTNRAFGEWLKWTYDAYKVWMEYKDRPFETTMHTHSCYRYFRPCSFMPICDIAEDDPPVTLSELVDNNWHPEEG